MHATDFLRDVRSQTHQTGMCASNNGQLCLLSETKLFSCCYCCLPAALLVQSLVSTGPCGGLKVRNNTATEKSTTKGDHTQLTKPFRFQATHL